MMMKNTRITRILCLPIHVVWLLGFKKNKNEKKNDPKKKNWKHIVKGWGIGSYLMAWHVNSLTLNKSYAINNLSPNNKPRSAQIFHD
jgi:hypothetical protein